MISRITTTVRKMTTNQPQIYGKCSKNSDSPSSWTSRVIPNKFNRYWPITLHRHWNSLKLWSHPRLRRLRKKQINWQTVLLLRVTGRVRHELRDIFNSYKPLGLFQGWSSLSSSGMVCEVKNSDGIRWCFFKTPTRQNAAEWGSFGFNYKLRQVINEMTNELSLAS